MRLPCPCRLLFVCCWANMWLRAHVHECTSISSFQLHTYVNMLLSYQVSDLKASFQLSVREAEALRLQLAKAEETLAAATGARGGRAHFGVSSRKQRLGYAACQPHTLHLCANCRPIPNPRPA